MPKPIPDLSVEREMFAAGATCIAALDEVGRGAWAGPVTLGAVLVTSDITAVPDGITDSKHLTVRQRDRLEPVARQWVHAYAVGSASPDEIDTLGIVRALRLAGRRALDALDAPFDAVLLDGSHNYLSDPSEAADPRYSSLTLPPVRVEVKGDERCGSIAAASIIAKVHRDRLMIALAEAHPHYGWERNAGYMAPAHLAAARANGLTTHHRRSWSVPA